MKAGSLTVVNAEYNYVWLMVHLGRYSIGCGLFTVPIDTISD